MALRTKPHPKLSAANEKLVVNIAHGLLSAKRAALPTLKKDGARMKGMFAGYALRSQVAMVFEAARLRSRIVDAIFLFALAAYEPVWVSLHTVVQLRLTIDVSNCLCCHLARFYPTKTRLVS
jgi:hypothetical protein